MQQNEENAVVLDYLPTGKSSAFKSEPVAQVIGTSFFTLLEIIPKEPLKAMEEIYVGKEERSKVQYIKRRVSFNELTNNSVAEIEKVIEKIVLLNQKKFLEFFNTARPLSIRMHQLELLPGLGKKHTSSILSEREKKPFDSFEDLEKRVHLMPNSANVLVKRIMLELEEPNLKYYLFVRPPFKPYEEQRFKG